MMKSFQGKRITVLGLGVSGLASARFLAAEGARVWATECQDSADLRREAEALRALGVEVELGQHSMVRALEADCIVTSPGIELDHPLIKEAERRDVPVKVEIELAAGCCSNRIVAITGTNGKSSVTAMVAHMLHDCGIPARACGNIGKPFLGELKTLDDKTVVVLELSSFQLARLEGFQPHVAILLNITPDHINWHRSFDAYADAKMNIFRAQCSDQFALVHTSCRRYVRALGAASQVRWFEGAGGIDPNTAACLEAARVFGIEPQRAQEASNL